MVDDKRQRIVNEFWLPEFDDFCEVFQHGMDKGYSKEGWLTNPLSPTMKQSENCDHMFHHLAKMYSGEALDPDSGLAHALHLVDRAQMYYTRVKRGLYHPEDKR